MQHPNFIDGPGFLGRSKRPPFENLALPGTLISDMHASSLDGLNILLSHPEHPDPQNLLSGLITDNTAEQLEIWATLPFDFDDGSASSKVLTSAKRKRVDVQADTSNMNAHELADEHGVVTTGSESGNEDLRAFDIQAFLAEFGVEPSSEAASPQSSVTRLL